MAISGFLKQMFTIVAITISVSEAGLIAVQEASNLTLADCAGSKVANCQTDTDPPVACNEKYVETVPGAEGVQCGAWGADCMATGPDGCSGENCFCALSAAGPKSCLELFEEGKTTDGIYEIQPNEQKIEVFLRHDPGWRWLDTRRQVQVRKQERRSTQEAAGSMVCKLKR